MRRLLLLTVACTTWAGSPDWQVRLQQALPITPQDFERIAEGEAVGRVIHFEDSKALGIMGAIRLPGKKEEFWKWYSDVKNFKRSEMLSQVWKIHTPPQLEDFSQYEMSSADLDRVRNCKPKACGIKATAPEIERIQREDGRLQGNAEALAVVRELLLNTVSTYHERGNAALPVYEDRKVTMDVGKETQELIGSSADVLELLPGLRPLLEARPKDIHDEQFYFGSVEKYGFGLKPVLNLLHVIMHRPAPEVMVICTKQLRATHYYDASLSITMLFDRKDGGTTLVYVNRSRIDALDNISGWKRSIIERFAPRAIRRELNTIRNGVTSSGIRLG